jgi:small subunit ribosomal protein S7
MSRRHAAEKRIVSPDARYHSVVVTKLINKVMLSGKKSIAETIVYHAAEQLASRTKRDALEGLIEAINNIKPQVEVRSRRIGGSTYQIPTEVSDNRQLALAIKWLVDAARKRSDAKTMSDKLAAELRDSYEGKGGAVKKKEDTHKMAEANKAFAHYKVA